LVAWLQNWVWKAKKEEQSAAEAKAQAQAKALEEERKRQERQEKIRSAAAVLKEAVLWLSLVWYRHQSKTCSSQQDCVLRAIHRVCVCVCVQDP
jgi:hypothetical protein